MTPFGIALFGCGTVGTGVARLLLEHGPRLAERAGRPLELRHILVRNPAKPRDAALPARLFTTDVRRVIHDPAVHVAVEVMGGTDPARAYILELLAAGKDVVTANKALLAEHGTEVFRTAHQAGRTVAFEASVGGGIPIIHALTQGLSANEITSIKAILNGTSNYILTQMTEQGAGYTEALAEAQRLGFAEADPTLDVNGTDAAQKLAILARLAFGAAVPVDAFARRGIDDVQQADVRFAGELGYVIKLLAEGWRAEDQLALHVEPTLVHRTAPLAQVRGPYNAIFVEGDVVGDTLYYGRGAGRMPTASAVLADVIDLALGRAQATFGTLRLGLSERPPRLRSVRTIRSRFYLRLTVQDRPGVIGEAATVLGKHQVSIASVIQHEELDEHEGMAVPLVLMTHTANLLAFRDAVEAIDRLGCVMAPSVYYPVAD